MVLRGTKEFLVFSRLSHGLEALEEYGLLAPVGHIRLKDSLVDIRLTSVDCKIGP